MVNPDSFRRQPKRRPNPRRLGHTCTWPLSLLLRRKGLFICSNNNYFFFFFFLFFRKEYGFECDRWSLAMILFELMESTHPFDGRNDVQVGMKVQKGEVKPLRSKRPKELVVLYNSLRNMVCTCVNKKNIHFFYW
jgi:serine/threonine protein kinase